MNDIKILKFEAVGCQPCEMVSAFLSENEIEYIRVNAFDEPELAVKYKIRSLPTIIALKGDEVIKKIVGYNREELESLKG